MKYLLIVLLSICVLPAWTQKKIEGLVSDEQNIALPGANVYLEGTYDGSSTDVSGHFSFETTEDGEQCVWI